MECAVLVFLLAGAWVQHCAGVRRAFSGSGARLRSVRGILTRLVRPRAVRCVLQDGVCPSGGSLRDFSSDLVDYCLLALPLEALPQWQQAFVCPLGYTTDTCQSHACVALLLAMRALVLPRGKFCPRFSFCALAARPVVA